MVREMTGFPPFSKLAAHFLHRTESRSSRRFSIRSKEFIKKVAEANNLSIEILGPAPVGIEKGQTNLLGILFVEVRGIRLYIWP